MLRGSLIVSEHTVRIPFLFLFHLLFCTLNISFSISICTTMNILAPIPNLETLSPQKQQYILVCTSAWWDSPFFSLSAFLLHTVDVFTINCYPCSHNTKVLPLEMPPPMIPPETITWISAHKHEVRSCCFSFFQDFYSTPFDFSTNFFSYHPSHLGAKTSLLHPIQVFICGYSIVVFNL